LGEVLGGGGAIPRFGEILRRVLKASTRCAVLRGMHVRSLSETDKNLTGGTLKVQLALDADAGIDSGRD
jgi:hypothetical protein